MRICTNCAIDNYLKEYINSHGSQGVCYLCESQETSVDLSKDTTITNIIKTLMRYNYANNPATSECFDCITDKNCLFKTNCYISERDDYQDFLFELVGDYYPEPTEGTQFIYNKKYPYLVRIKNEKHEDIIKWERMLGLQNYYDIEYKLYNSLKECACKICQEISINDCYRARIGLQLEFSHFDFEEEIHTNFYIPFIKSQMNPPPVRLAKEGRFNREKVSFMYVASDKETAVSEIKPSIGHKISVGKFNSIKKLKMLDFSKICIYDFCNTENDIEQYKFLSTLADRFSLPRANGDYYFTQIVAENIKRLGYDGIIYESTVANGINYLIFDCRLMDYVIGSEEVIEINCVSYEMVQLKTNAELVDENEEYYKEGGTVEGRDIKPFLP